ncbi:MAG TPA: DUF1800 domain-containing protein [Abditibacterium sp.]|jgi:uncharacterized protein (DUF1800 family)
MKPRFAVLSIVSLATLSSATLFKQNALAAPEVAPKIVDSAFEKPLTGQKRLSHWLNRLAFGPRPGDLQTLSQIGEKAWLERQLNPQTIQDSALETQLKSLGWLHESPAKLALAYETDTSNFLKKLRKAENGEMMASFLNERQKATQSRIEAGDLPEKSSVQAIGELITDKLARATSSEKQLQEVLVDFWSNHFNVDVKKGPVRGLKILDDRETIRPHVFGNFRDMLGASAHSPAMMWYLDNARSTREMNAGKGMKRGGINENYARELMELHTLGVEGGYSQTDVTEVARCFTGWSVNQQTGEFIFRARAHDEGEKTVLGQKIAANGGQKDGERVLDILANHPATAQFIARKLCVRFVSDAPPEKLVKRVAAAFSASQGDLKTAYRAIFSSPEFASEGAYRSKIKSPFEFSVSAVRILGGSMQIGGSERGNLRLIAIGGASLNNANGNNPALRRLLKRPLATEIAAMGQPLFSCQPPTGYAEDSRKWVSSSALVARLNFALSLTGGRIGDVTLQSDTFRVAPLEEVSTALLDGDISPATRTTIEAEAQKSPGDGAKLRALLLASPEFQRR